MTLQRGVSLAAAVLLLLATLVGCARSATAGGQHGSLSFSTSSGGYTLHFDATHGALLVQRTGSAPHLTIREIPGGKGIDLLYAVRTVQHQNSGFVLRGRSAWTSFVMRVSFVPGVPGMLHLALAVTPYKDAPTAGTFAADVAQEGKPRSALKEYAPAPPVAGSSVMVSSRALHSTMLYFENFTSLGHFFDRAGTGVTQGVFSYPNAGQQGSLVGATGTGSFGYPISANDLNSLPHGRSTQVLDSYLYLQHGIPGNEAAVSTQYLHMLGTVYGALPKPVIPVADWPGLAQQEATDLLDPANLVTVNGTRYLRSYVSDTRSAPELITQAGVLAGVKTYEARFHVVLPIDAVLEGTLPHFYDDQYHSIVNGVGHDPQARGESWYFVTNMISLLQLAQLGDGTAKKLLLDSTGSLMTLAHVNGYEFPQNFAYSTWNGKGTGLQSDVAGGYAWLMLGLYDLTKQPEYLAEAQVSINHVAGKGFGLAYETHMTAYTAAAAERLYTMTGKTPYRQDALLALANLFHATRLWDCTYGYCHRGTGYHTYFGLNPLPWSDYIAMLEQYEAWLGLRDYMHYASSEPAYVKDLVQGFITETPLTMQYALPPRLPAGAATSAAGEYAFVPHNNLAWSIPLEDLREGEQNSGLIGQEIYGAGGPFMFAALEP